MLTRVRAAQADRVPVGQSDRDQKNVDSRKNYTQRSQSIEVNRDCHLLTAVNFNDVPKFMNLIAARYHLIPCLFLCVEITRKESIDSNAEEVIKKI